MAIVPFYHLISDTSSRACTPQWCPGPATADLRHKQCLATGCWPAKLESTLASCSWSLDIWSL